MNTIVALRACAAVTLTEIFEAFSSLLLSTRRSTAFSSVTRTARFVSATRFEPWYARSVKATTPDSAFGTVAVSVSL